LAFSGAPVFSGREASGGLFGGCITGDNGHPQWVPLMGVGASPQYTLLVLEAALPLAPSLLLIAAQPLGHRARSSLCRPACSGSWLPSESTQRSGVPEVRKGVAHRRVDYRDDGGGPGSTADTRGAVSDALEAIVTVGPDHHQCHRRDQVGVTYRSRRGHELGHARARLDGARDLRRAVLYAARRMGKGTSSERPRVAHHRAAEFADIE
jgi:hypothetical protein